MPKFYTLWAPTRELRRLRFEYCFRCGQNPRGPPASRGPFRSDTERWEALSSPLLRPLPPSPHPNVPAVQHQDHQLRRAQGPAALLPHHNHVAHLEVRWGESPIWWILILRHQRPLGFYADVGIAGWDSLETYRHTPPEKSTRREIHPRPHRYHPAARKSASVGTYAKYPTRIPR